MQSEPTRQSAGHQDNGQLAELPGLFRAAALLLAMGNQNAGRILQHLSDEELQALKAIRARAIERARANDDAKHSGAARAARKILLPAYSYSNLSIYIHRTDGFPLEIYPKEARAERGQVFTFIILSICQRITTQLALVHSTIVLVISIKSRRPNSVAKVQAQRVLTGFEGPEPRSRRRPALRGK